ncbi:acyltransferase family protein [Microbacterium lacus]|uniref:acyltransferase family protein n=1 Tax=Microbacterium lacus TaxID=415217 RepID=UPI0018E26433|nr:acyltransferase [Microbacterium lacus]
MTGETVKASRAPISGRPAKGYLPQLDGLRAIAVALVLVYHFITPIPFAGQVGVDVFFVLSGYLITSILLAEHEHLGRIRLKLFFARRAIRLYPPLLLVIAVMLVFGLLLAPSIPKFLAETGFALTYTTPIVLEFANGASVMWRHTWSLGVEEIFYLVWPLLLLLLLRARPGLQWKAGAVLGVGLAMAVTQVILMLDGDRMSILLRSGGLLFGCAVALCLRQSGRRYAAAWGWAGLAAIAFGVAASTILHNESIGVLLTLGARVRIGWRGARR